MIGGANLASALALRRRHPFAPLASLATGLLLVAPIAIRPRSLGSDNWSQLSWWATFVLVTALAAPRWRAAGGRRGS